jgi:hypothetical protein
MRDFLIQIKRALDENLYYLSLFSVLTIPDLCGALSSENGEASAEKYKTWFDKYVAAKYNGFLLGEDCYRFRCSMLHQGSSQLSRSRYERIIFVEPSGSNNIIMHNNIINNALNIDVRIFCQSMIDSAEQWLAENERTELYENNYSKFMKRYPNGLTPYIVGVPVIS